MKKTIIGLLLISLAFVLNAQSLFTPENIRVKTAILEKQAKLLTVTSTKGINLASETTTTIFSLTAQVNGFAYEIGPGSGGKLLNGAGIGISYGGFALVNDKSQPIWDISALLMTSVQMTDLSFTGAGGLVAIGFNPGYLVGIGGNIMIREGFMYLGTQGFTNMKPYLVTGIGISL